MRTERKGATAAAAAGAGAGGAAATFWSPGAGVVTRPCLQLLAFLLLLLHGHKQPMASIVGMVRSSFKGEILVELIYSSMFQL